VNTCRTRRERVKVYDIASDPCNFSLIVATHVNRIFLICLAVITDISAVRFAKLRRKHLAPHFRGCFDYYGQLNVK
jgi:hypothetical protein